MSVNPPNQAVRWIVIYPSDSVIHLAFEQPESDLQRATPNEQRASLALSAI